MPADEKQPEDNLKEAAPEGAAEPGADEEIKEPEEHPRKHKRKGELRTLHDRDRDLRKQGKGHDPKIFRRKSI